MLGWLRPAAARASRRNRSTNPWSPASERCRTLIATSRVEDGVVGTEDLAHAAGGDALQDVVAAVERGETQASVRGGPRRAGSYSWTWRFLPSGKRRWQAGRSASGRISYGRMEAGMAEGATGSRAGPDQRVRPDRAGGRRGATPTCRRLGFWRLVKRVKLSPEAVGALRRAGRPDRRGRRSARGVPRRWPVWLGNAVLDGRRRWRGRCHRASRCACPRRCWRASRSWRPAPCGRSRSTASRTGSSAGSSASGSPTTSSAARRPRGPGLKTDYATYLRTPAERRAWMHASGAIATKVAPFVAAAVLEPRRARPCGARSCCSRSALLQIVTDVLFSVRSSDWKKVLRERAVAREVEALDDVAARRLYSAANHRGARDGPG